MIEDFNDGLSRSFFCKAATLLDLTSLTSSLDKATQKTKTNKIKRNDVKKTQILKEIINEAAFKEGIEFVKKK
jgi:hypothetical protein